MTVAQSLLSQAGVGVPAEGAVRTAVSRAYYAAFGHALRYASTHLGFLPKQRAEEKSQDHGRLKAHLRARRRAGVADILDRLRDWRNQCDYADDLANLDLPRVAEAAMRDAAKLFVSLTPPTTSPGNLP